MNSSADFLYPLSSGGTLSPQSQQALRQLADSFHVLMWATDVDDVCIYLNKEALKLLAPGERFRLADWLQFIHPDDLPKVVPSYRRAKATRDEYQVEYRIIRSDGSVRWVLNCGAPRYDADDRYIGYGGTVLDITAQHDALARLAKSEAELRLVTDNSTDLIAHSGPDGRYLYVSPAYKSLLGFSSEELVGKNVYDFLHPDDRENGRRKIKEHIETGRDIGVVEVRKRHRDGRYIWVGAKIHKLNDPTSGDYLGAVIISRNINEEHEARSRLRRSEERFRSLTQLSSDWYWESDNDGRFTYFSDGLLRTTGIDPAYWLGKHLRDIVVDTGQSELAAYEQSVALRSAVRGLMFQLRAPSGEAPRYTEISGEAVIEDGREIGYRGVARDVTVEREMLNRMASMAEQNTALIENAPDIMLLFDDGGRILHANRAVLPVLGFQPQEMLGRHYLSFIASSALQQSSKFSSIMRDRASEEDISDFDIPWLHKDGGMVHLAWNVRRVPGSPYAYATARDVTEQQLTREELQNAHQRLNAILESIGDCFFSVDREWRVTYANRNTAAFVGLEYGSAIGDLIFDVIPELRASSVFPYYERAMRTGENTTFETFYEPNQAWVNVRVYPHENGLSVFYHDVTARVQADQAARESEQRYREMIEITPAGYVLTDALGVVADVNPALCALIGYERNEIVGREMTSFLALSQMEYVPRMDCAAGAHTLEAVLRHKQGHLVYVVANATIKHDTLDRPSSLTAFITDITERKQSEERMEYLATRDTLTGLPNRAFINTQLATLLQDENLRSPVAVLFIDLDGFKEVNDSFGHGPGDLLLQQIAGRLHGCMRAGETVARLGGDEFVVVAVCEDGCSSASRIAGNIFSVLATPFDIDGQEMLVSASIGIAMSNDARSTPAQLFQQADTAMYKAKTTSRSSYQFFTPEMSAMTRTRLVMEQGLRKALALNEFELHYQPRVDLHTMRVVGVEALIRWNHPELGRIPPLQFIPIAEERGYIDAIGKWVIEEACRQARRLSDKCGHPLHVAVNLSARQLKNPDLVRQVEHALQASGLAPEMLELEITESALIDDMDFSASILMRLKSIGVMLSVDDFGTGYSSLSYLKRFPVDILKLDRSFVNQQSSGVSSLQFIKAFVDMAHALKLAVVAEGIETADVLDMLNTAVCDEGQGYLFSKPLPPDELEQYLAAVKPGVGVLKGTGVTAARFREAIDVSEENVRVFASEQVQRLLSEHSGDLVSFHLPGGSYVYASPSYKRITGHESVELIGQPVYDFLHPSDFPAVSAEIKRQLEGADDSQSMEVRVLHRKGHYLWVETKVRIVNAEISGEWIGSVCISRDITAERHAKEELRNRNERLKSLARLSADWYWETDASGRFTFISDGAFHAAGMPAETVIGKSRFGPDSDIEGPGLLACQTAMLSREPFRNLQSDDFFPFAGKRKYARMSGEPVFEQGVFMGYRGISTDISTEIECNASLERLASENRALVENSPDLTMLIDASGRILRANSKMSGLLGCAPADMTGETFEHAASKQGVDIGALRDVLHCREVRDHESRWTRKDGAVLHFAWSTQWSEGRKVMHVTARDVTDRQLAHAGLQRSMDEIKMLVESSDDGIVSLDRQWRIRYANMTSAAIIGMKPEEVVGAVVWDVLPELRNPEFYLPFSRAMEHVHPACFEACLASGKKWAEVRVYPQETGVSIFFRDCTEKREAVQSLLRSEQRLREVIEMTPSGFMRLTAAGDLLECNRALCMMTGYERDELHRISYLNLFKGDPLAAAMVRHSGDGMAHGREAVIRHKDGQEVVVLFSAITEYDDEGRLAGATVFVTDITSRKQAELRLSALATHDPLTGVANRNYLEEHLPYMLRHAARGQQNAVMFIDLDHFKEVNDTLGHGTGDAVLCELAARIRRDVRHSDIVARLGGDEFVVVAPCAEGEHVAATIAAKLLSALTAPIVVEGRSMVLGASIGISMFPKDGSTLKELLECADIAMYDVKMKGRNGYRFYDASDRAQASDAGKP